MFTYIQIFKINEMNHYLDLLFSSKYKCYTLDSASLSEAVTCAENQCSL